MLYEVCCERRLSLSIFVGGNHQYMNKLRRKIDDIFKSVRRSIQRDQIKNLYDINTEAGCFRIPVQDQENNSVESPEWTISIV